MTSIWRQVDGKKDDSSSAFFQEPWGTHSPTMVQRWIIAITQNTILQRGALRKLMAKLIMSLRSPLDIEFRGCKYRIEVRNNLIERGLLTRPSYNAQEIEFLQHAVRDGGVAVDIGSNIGLYSLPLADMAGSQGQVLAIDANMDMIERLSFNAKASGLTNVNAVHMAVGEKEARVNLQIRKDDVAIVRVEESATGSTEMRPLLRILADSGVDRVDSLKIDVEGHEDAAMVPFLKEASENLLPSRIVIERASRSYDYPGCVAEFERLGYRLVDRTLNNSMYERS